MVHILQLLLASPPAWLLSVVVVMALWGLRWLLLPRPIPGIPYRHQSAGRILGDIPDMLQWIRETGEIASFIPNKASKEMNSPIFQLFMRPFARPWVVITDFRETQDIVTRRTREFDRSDFFRDMFKSLVPGSMVHMSTNDTWRAQRKRVGDTMTPAFLENVSAPSIYTSGMALIGLWQEKARLAKGHPFSVKEDLHRSGLDTIWAVTFGTQIGATLGQLNALSTLDSIPVPSNNDSAVEFTKIEEPEAFKSILAITDSMDIPVSSIIPQLQHYLALKLLPSLARASRHKDRLINNKIDEAVAKFSSKEPSEDDVDCALDHVILREVQISSRENRTPDLKSIYIKDELFAFMVAGHDTSATTLSWGLKLLTDNQRAQDELRSRLFATFKDARSGIMPSVAEISKLRLPYLDATLEEIYRLAGTSSAIFRKTTTDVVVLGHVVPKGTDVCMITFGPDFVQPAIPVLEEKRSASSQESKGKNGSWDSETIQDFLPERWLTDAGEFNPQAGPSMLFGGGMRGCFGRRLAELQIKMLLTMIIWTFRLEAVPADLSSYKSKDAMTHAPRQCFLRLSGTRGRR